MDMLGGGEMNELMSTKMCSPMMIYLGIVIVTGLSTYITRNHLKRHNTNKMENKISMDQNQIKLDKITNKNEINVKWKLG